MTEEIFVLEEIESEIDSDRVFHQSVAVVMAVSFEDAVKKLGADFVSRAIDDKAVYIEVTFSFEQLSSSAKVWHDSFSCGRVDFVRVDESGDMLLPPLVIEFDRNKKTAIHKYKLRKVVL
jgi:hypothetical protein